MTHPQRLLSDSALLAFRLNGQFLALADDLAAPAGLTATRWQVLGAVVSEPLPVSQIARDMGITRQSVQRTADLLAHDGLVEYLPNPAHRRAKLVTPTVEGREAMARISPGHARAAARLTDEVGAQRWETIVEGLRALSAALDAIEDRPT
ncbi:MarR family transcriptional regulator [Williamsia sp. Leaf354]|uniref:MarR family winged helix-turn-helix transcriptional regulator n=1 Tax=Williamsia sp. Leaf354 TaxID=1736349 RepID=UPI0006F7E4DA|nr:MarR family transcriptional regulator [Williamsia sp. Leaf354]KQR98766.1 MarR family transcriptional regulator [Williamsia sp. Leaf354]